MEEKEVNVKYKDKISVAYTVSQEVVTKFREWCDSQGMKMSPRIELFMKKDAEQQGIL